MYTDLHMHTNYSDGEFSPIELIKRAKQANVTTMAITDHNNLKGSKEAILSNPYSDIVIIPGVEFTAKSNSNIDIHILGYNIDLNEWEINDLANAYEIDAKKRVKSLVDLMYSEYRISFADEKLEKMFSRLGNIGRPEVAKLCVEEGYAKDVEDAFKRLLNPIKSKQVKKQVDPTDEALIKYIIDAGGIPCLAHPSSLKMAIHELRDYIYKLMSYGLKAVEVYHSKNPLFIVKELEKITNEYGLLQSVGSDYHGPVVSPNIHIGRGKNNNLNIQNVSILDKMTNVKGYDGVSKPQKRVV